MFGAVAFLVSESVYTGIAIWRGDVAALAALRRLVGRRPIVAATFFVLGIVFGLLTAATAGMDFFAGWLIAAYVMVVALFVVNGLPVVQKGLLNLTEHAVEADAGRRSPDEVRSEMAAFRGRFVIVVAVNVSLFVALVLDMVLKPF
jgi:hypothetical protein